MLKEKKELKVSLNIKIEPHLDAKLRDLRGRARSIGLIYNVSGEVVSFLEERIKVVEKEIEKIEDYSDLW